MAHLPYMFVSFSDGGTEKAESRIHFTYKPRIIATYSCDFPAEWDSES